MTYSDHESLDVSTIAGNNAAIRVTGPDGFDQLATFVSIDDASDGSPRVATYHIEAPTSTWQFEDNGTYTISLVANQIADTSGNFSPAGELGTFAVNIANMASVLAHHVSTTTAFSMAPTRRPAATTTLRLRRTRWRCCRARRRTLPTTPAMPEA